MSIRFLVQGQEAPGEMSMKASTERMLIRWLHIIVSIPIVGYIYGPVSQIPQAVIAVRYVIFPALVLSGLWLWKGYVIKNLKRRIMASNEKRPGQL